jgi:hypothetical protein
MLHKGALQPIALWPEACEVQRIPAASEVGYPSARRLRGTKIPAGWHGPAERCRASYWDWESGRLKPASVGRALGRQMLGRLLAEPGSARGLRLFAHEPFAFQLALRRDRHQECQYATENDTARNTQDGCARR